MITILVVLEKGYESSFEHLAFRQLKNAWGVNLCCVPHDCETLEEALDLVSNDTLVYMMLPGRVEHSTEFKDFVLPSGDVTFVLGSPQENLVNYVGNDIALHITTPNPSVDMMAVCVAGIILNEYG